MRIELVLDMCNVSGKFDENLKVDAAKIVDL